jgi:DNA-binding beta-propeller fold protein YncE
MYFEQRPDHDRRATFELLGHVAVLAALFGVGACSASDPTDPSADNNAFAPGGGFADMGASGGGGGFADMGPQEPPFIPEIEEDFTFSQPAVVGSEVFIANETLNSVAVIDSTSLAIRTLPVGFRPTAIVGPKRDASTDASRVVVLNEGSNSVSVIDPLTRATQLLDVMDGANALTANADSSAVVAWYDDALFEDGDPRGDLSSITLIKGADVYQIAVGFHVRKVVWIEGSSRLLIVTDDGVSVIKTDEVTEDRVQVPVAVLPRELIPQDPRDLEVLVDVTGSFAVARVSSFSGVVVTSLDEQVHHVINLPEIPTDIDMIGGDVPGVMVMLPRTEAAVVMSLPDGAVNAAAASIQIDEQDPDMGQPMDEDMPVDMAPPEDMGADDMDMMPEDMAMEDMPVDMEASDDMGEDMMPVDMSSPAPDMAPAQSPLEDFMGLDGVDVIALPGGFALGAAVISEGGEQALMYTTLSNSKIGMLHAFERGESRDVFFEKGIKAVIADKGGETFLAFHSRDEEAGAGDVIASSWGLSVVDVSSATPRLVITAHEPWRATLWSVDGFAPRAYVIFKRPVDEALVVATQRDVLGVNLDTFSVNSFRVSSSPEGIGAIPAAGRVYVNQTHPQGRMTFVDVDSGKQQTVTGYQLNARID